MLVALGSEIAMEICGAKDWNVSATFCSSEPVPVLPACFQHVVLSLPPLVFIIFGAFQIFGAATRNKLKVRHCNFFIHILIATFQLKKLKPLSNIRLSVIGGLIISQLCVLAQTSDLLIIEAISAGIIFALLIILGVVVFVQDLAKYSLHFISLLFLASISFQQSSFGSPHSQ